MSINKVYGRSGDENMNQVTSSQIIMYAGIASMLAAIILAIICAVVFHITGKKLKQKLNEEYGEPYK